MSNDVQQTAPETESQAEAPAITIETASFSDYERLRRGEKVESESQEKPSAPAAKQPEQKKAGESDPSETESTKEESESEEEESQEGTESKETETDKPKKKGFQRRVEKLNARISAAQQEAEYWKREAMKTATAQSAASKTDTAKPETQGKPNPDDFDTHAEYVEAITDWKINQRDKTREAKEQKSRLESDHEKLIRSHRERVEAFSEKTDDFEEMMTNLEDVPRSLAVEQVILESDHGPELLYELAKNPAEAKRIAKLPPLRAAIELGKIEEKLEARTSEAKKPETKKITQAPKPIEPLTKGSSKVTKTIFDPDTSFADYERMRREQMKRRR